MKQTACATPSPPSPLPRGRCHPQCEAATPQRGPRGARAPPGPARGEARALSRRPRRGARPGAEGDGPPRGSPPRPGRGHRAAAGGAAQGHSQAPAERWPPRGTQPSAAERGTCGLEEDPNPLPTPGRPRRAEGPRLPPSPPPLFPPALSGTASSSPRPAASRGPPLLLLLRRLTRGRGRQSR